MEVLVGKILLTFIAGIVSVLSPCFLPVLPGFIAYLSGLSLQEARSPQHRKDLLINCLFFSIGFCLIFGLFGFSLGIVSKLLVLNQILIIRISGFLLILFGLLQSGVLKIKFLQKSFQPTQTKNIKIGGKYQSFFIGMLFAFSWSPCYGPIIGAIFTLAANSQSMLEAMIFFIIYSLGFTLPIILIGLLFDKLSIQLKKHRQAFLIANFLAGIVLIIIGLLMLTNSINSIVNWLSFIYNQSKLIFY
jgi:cytochrome c-type biogenesis protein